MGRHAMGRHDPLNPPFLRPFHNECFFFQSVISIVVPLRYSDGICVRPQRFFFFFLYSRILLLLLLLLCSTSALEVPGIRPRSATAFVKAQFGDPPRCRTRSVDDNVLNEYNNYYPVQRSTMYTRCRARDNIVAAHKSPEQAYEIKYIFIVNYIQKYGGVGANGTHSSGVLIIRKAYRPTEVSYP